MLNLILMPAYGKRYQTNSEALADWNAGKDFRVVGCGPYCSIRDKNHLQRNHHNVILHSEEGGTYVIKSVPPCNLLDSLL